MLFTHFVRLGSVRGAFHPRSCYKWDGSSDIVSLQKQARRPYKRLACRQNNGLDVSSTSSLERLVGHTLNVLYTNATQTPNWDVFRESLDRWFNETRSDRIHHRFLYSGQPRQILRSGLVGFLQLFFFSWEFDLKGHSSIFFSLSLQLQFWTSNERTKCHVLFWVYTSYPLCQGYYLH